MTANTTTPTRHDCAERGCLAAMLGVELLDATANDAEEGSSSN